MRLVAEWISLTEMKELQNACMLVSMKAREKEYEEFLFYQDDQVWKEMSEEWQQYLTEKRRKPSPVIKAWANDTIQHRGRWLGFLLNLTKVLRLRLQDEETNTPESASPK